VRNEEVYRRIGEERTLWSTICQRRTRWVGHVMRQNNYVGSIWGIEGKAPRGKLETSICGVSRRIRGRSAIRK
jgi:hypothetical protein